MTVTLTFTQSEYWQRVLECTDETGTPINFTGYTAKMQIRLTAKSPTSVATLDSDDGSIVLDTGGNVTLTLTSDQTNSIGAGRYVSDLFVVAPGDKPRVLVKFEIVVQERITKL